MNNQIHDFVKTTNVNIMRMLDENAGVHSRDKDYPSHGCDRVVTLRQMDKKDSTHPQSHC